MILIYACKTSMAKSITAVMPYLPYSKQCRMLRRSAIPMKLIADMICNSGNSYFLFAFFLPNEVIRLLLWIMDSTEVC